MGRGVAVSGTAAVFLDRDGTINDEVGYLDSLEKLKILPGAFEAIRLINASGMKAVVITNQSGVARGYFDEAFVENVHGRIQALLKEHNARIDGFYYCPHHPTEGTGAYRITCACRKPEAGLLMRAAQELGVDPARSYMVGDMPKDIEAAARAGAKGILVRTGHGAKLGTEPLFCTQTIGALSLIPASAPPHYVAADLLDAVKWILKDRNP
jgi:D,D-heptose 1,7-bisphosphate phosphatase